GGHAATGFQWLWGEAGPDDEAVGDRIAGRDPELEREVRKDGIGPGTPAGNEAGCACREGEEKTAARRGRGAAKVWFLQLEAGEG
ncbi:MAG: hypothetical protein ACKOD3_09035, partial [Phenylobacterium sp.]